MPEASPSPVPPPAHPAASVILLRGGSQQLEVLLLKRHEKSSVHGGVHVFPGGKVDEADRVQAASGGLDVTGLASGFGDPLVDDTLAASVRLAALRELQEECSVRLGGPADVRPWSRWITPLVSLAAKRFDTWFFVAHLPPGEVAGHDEHETVETCWTRPGDALAAHVRGDILLAPPQVMTLIGLCRFANAEAVMAHAATTPPPMIQPVGTSVDGQRLIAFPGDPLHAVREQVLDGPTRLLHREGRYEPPEGAEALLRWAART